MSIKLQERPFKLLQSWTWLRIALLLWAERKFTALKLNENETAVEESEEPFPFPQVTSDITWRFRKWIRTCPSCVATSGFFFRVCGILYASASHDRMLKLCYVIQCIGIFLLSTNILAWNAFIRILHCQWLILSG